MSSSTPPAAPTPTGLILIDKPAKRAVSSVTAVRKVKRALRAGGADVARMRVGHAGTLDPLASGLLIVLVGRGATRLCNDLMNGPKTYEATLDLLKSSPSDDLETETTINDLQRRPTREDVERALEGFRGVIRQRPPAFSAIWIDGVRAFKIARKAAEGRLPEMEARPVTIHELALVEYDFPLLTIRVRCSKGTYIRSLARDLGSAISGHPAVLVRLRRTAIGPYDVANATPLESLPERLTQSDLIPVG
ncbi:MAG TPA: tRNA pseudouridine(55) synthase TruB [Phycisphaerales bacterium]|nr:tRNA pseudouridine(55) synthase TruB [Phycisphaerales bacterium]